MSALMTTLTPEEINACKPGDKVRLDGLVLTRSFASWWLADSNHPLPESFLTLPGVTVTKLEDEDLLLARECAARAWTAAGYPEAAAYARKGKQDTNADIQSALLAIKAVRGEKP